MADFQQFYGLNLEDLWTGRLSVRRTLILSGQLRAIPDSRMAGIHAGGVEFIGWDEDRRIAVETHDTLAVLVAGLSGESNVTPYLYPRPSRSTPAQPDDGGTVADFDVAAFMRRLSN